MKVYIAKYYPVTEVYEDSLGKHAFTYYKEYFEEEIIDNRYISGGNG